MEPVTALLFGIVVWIAAFARLAWLWGIWLVDRYHGEVDYDND